MLIIHYYRRKKKKNSKRSTSFIKKGFFCFVVRGVYPSYTLSGPTQKKTFFMCVFPKWNLENRLRKPKLY